MPDDVECVPDTRSDRLLIGYYYEPGLSPMSVSCVCAACVADQSLGGRLDGVVIEAYLYTILALLVAAVGGV